MRAALSSTRASEAWQRGGRRKREEERRWGENQRANTRRNVKEGKRQR
jgi:hypothetical protein